MCTVNGDSSLRCDKEFGDRISEQQRCMDGYGVGQVARAHLAAQPRLPHRGVDYFPTPAIDQVSSQLRPYKAGPGRLVHLAILQLCPVFVVFSARATRLFR